MHGGNLRWDLEVDEWSHVFIELHPHYRDDVFSFVLSIGKKQEPFSGFSPSQCGVGHHVHERRCSVLFLR